MTKRARDQRMLAAGSFVSHVRTLPPGPAPGHALTMSKIEELERMVDALRLVESPFA